MSRLAMTVKGSPKDHEILSESMTDDDAKRHLESASKQIGMFGSVVVPGATAQGPDVLAVRVVPDRHGQPVGL